MAKGDKYKGEGTVLINVVEFSFEDDGINSIEDQANDALLEASEDREESWKHSIDYYKET